MTLDRRPLPARFVAPTRGRRLIGRLRPGLACAALVMLFALAGDAHAEEITFSVTSSNVTGGAITFRIVFSSSFTAVNCPCTVSSVLGVTVTDNTGNGATILPVAPVAGVPVDADGVTEFLVGTASPDGGGTLFNMGVDIGTGASAPAGNAGVPFTFSFTGGPQTFAGGPFDQLQAILSFSLPAGATVRFDGRLSIVSGTAAVPEPATLVLLGTGLAGVIGAARRRRRR